MKSTMTWRRTHTFFCILPIDPIWEQTLRGRTRKGPSAFGTQQQVAISANDVINRMFPKRSAAHPMNQMHRVEEGGNGLQPTAQSRERSGGGKDEKDVREGFSRGDSAAAIRITCRSIDRFAAAPPGKFAEGRRVIDFLGGTPGCRLAGRPVPRPRPPIEIHFCVNSDVDGARLRLVGLV